MFLCDTCHGDCPCKTYAFFRSRGKCEDCGEHASCIDCHNLNANPSARPTKDGRNED
jgi:hypothetical protein